MICDINKKGGKADLDILYKRIYNANQRRSGRLLLNRGNAETGNSRTNAFYMFARSLALTCAAAIPVFINAPAILLVVTTAMLIVQTVDCITGTL